MVTARLSPELFGAIGLSVECRKGHYYIYIRKRIDGRLWGRYLGRASIFDFDRFKRGRAARQRARKKSGEDRMRLEAEAKAILAAGEELNRALDQHFRIVMHLTGHHLHKRSTWRRRRGAARMDPADLFGPKQPADPKVAGPPQPRERSVPPAVAKQVRAAIVRPWSDDPEIQSILDRAAAGDEAVLPDVRNLLKHPRYVDGLGDMAFFALEKLISAAAGDDVAIREALLAKYQQMLAKLLADGGPEPTLAEEMAATRAAHAVLAVNTLEALANSQVHGSPVAISFERHLGKAERRLAGALRSLATLRQLRRRIVTKQVNIANGPIVVNSL